MTLSRVIALVRGGGARCALLCSHNSSNTTTVVAMVVPSCVIINLTIGREGDEGEGTQHVVFLLAAGGVPFRFVSIAQLTNFGPFYYAQIHQASPMPTLGLSPQIRRGGQQGGHQAQLVGGWAA